MANPKIVADIIFGDQGTISKRELKKLYKVSSDKALKQNIKTRAPGLKLPAVWGQVRTNFSDLFGIRLSDILVYGWDKFSRIGKALHPPPGESDGLIRIPLHNHIFTSEHHPRIDILYNGVTVDSLEFTLLLKLNFSSIVLVFKNGRLVELQPGECDGTAELRAKNVTIFARRLLRANLPSVIIHPDTKHSSESDTGDTKLSQPEPGKSSTHLPPPRKKRGCGCFLFLFLLVIMAGGTAYCLFVSPSLCQVIINQIQMLLSKLQFQFFR